MARSRCRLNQFWCGLNWNACLRATGRSASSDFDFWSHFQVKSKHLYRVFGIKSWSKNYFCEPFFVRGTLTVLQASVTWYFNPELETHVRPTEGGALSPSILVFLLPNDSLVHLLTNNETQLIHLFQLSICKGRRQMCLTIISGHVSDF